MMRRSFSVSFAIAALLTPAAAAQSKSAPALTNAAQIRVLTAAQAESAQPVTLRGVVVDLSEPRQRALILADATASIYISSDQRIFSTFQPRDLLEIQGVTSAGEFAPCVVATNVSLVSSGEAEIPPARPASYQEIITGALDAQFVEVGGVVRRVLPAAKGGDNWNLLLAANGGVLPLRVPLPQDMRIEVDDEVRVEAVCFYRFNQKRQALNPVLQVPHGRTMTIVRKSPADPFASPPKPLASLLQFSSDLPFGHRIHVRGVVTLVKSSSLVWIHDEAGGLRIQHHQSNFLRPGDQIDVLGFPAYGSSTPVLEDAIYRKLGSGHAAALLTLTNLADAFNHQDDLVCAKATLADVQAVKDGWILTLTAGGSQFKALLENVAGQVRPSAWQPGSLVRVVGVCEVIHESARPVMGVWRPQSFQLLMRSVDDLAVLQAPPWWNARHIILVLSCFIGALLVAGGAVAALARRRLLEQSRSRQLAEAEFAATLSERNRLAREMHDTLAQGFTATLLQLELVRNSSDRDPDSALRHLDTAEQLIRGSLREARNSIWQMQPQVLEAGDLAGALKEILEQLAEGVVAETGVEITGSRRRLAPAVKSNILRLGQEAITNSVKHSQATCLRVKLDFGESRFQLTIADNGRGFDPAHPPRSEGGFGIVGMQQRAKQLKGELIIRSRQDHGTEISLSLPLGDDTIPA
ncbi:MAG: histidine kinase [Verrucomicrobiota bacterium]